MYCEPTELKDISDTAAPSGKKDGALDIVEMQSGADDAVGEEDAVGSRLLVGEEEAEGHSTEVIVATEASLSESSEPSLLPVPPAVAAQAAIPATTVAAQAAIPAATVATAAAGPEDSSWFKFAKLIAIAVVGLGAIVSYATLHFFTGIYYWLLSGNQANAYMHISNEASYIGVLVALFACGEFLSGFSGMRHTRLTVAVKVFIALIVAIGGAQIGGPAGAMVGLLCAAGSVAMGFLAHFMRQAIPSTFRFNRAVFYNALAAIPAAALSVCAFYSAATNPLPRHRPIIYSDFGGSDFGLMLVVLLILLGIPAYLTARCARTSEVKPLIALGALLQSPLLLGFLVQLTISFTLPDGGLLGLAALGTMLTGLLAISGGAALGAITNGLLHHLKTNP